MKKFVLAFIVVGIMIYVIQSMLAALQSPCVKLNARPVPTSMFSVEEVEAWNQAAHKFLGVPENQEISAIRAHFDDSGKEIDSIFIEYGDHKVGFTYKLDKPDTAKFVNNAIKEMK